MYLKYYYPTEYMAAYLSMVDESKIDETLKVCRKLNINIKTPNINISQKDFLPNNNEIIYGIGAIKGVGDTSIPDILKYAPYKSLEDTIKRIPKRSFNKKVAVNLIKSGAFDSLYPDKNRNQIINMLLDLREEKEERLDETNISPVDIIRYEDEVLGTHLSYNTWWEDVPENKYINLDNLKIKTLKEQVDKNGNLMAFITFIREDVEFEGICFASKYSKIAGFLDKRIVKKVQLNGKKDNKGKFIINDAIPIAS